MDEQNTSIKAMDQGRWGQYLDSSLDTEPEKFCLSTLTLCTHPSEITLEADNVSVIQKLNEGGLNRSRVAPVIHDIRQEKIQFSRFHFAKIGREQNKVAHELAHLALSSGVCRVWFANFPESCVTLACKELP